MKKVKIQDFDLNTCFNQMPQDYQKQDDYYFDSYSHFAIHEEMLKDRVSLNICIDAILKNRHLFQDKIVLDLGCGTGILSMFSASAGAKHVYAIECANIVTQAREIIEINGFQNKITIIQGKVEEIVLPVEKVDIIVSEWMGYFLLYESMFDSVLFAKNKWLSQNGYLFPNKAQIFIAALEDYEYKNEKIYFWEDVWGFDMSNIKKLATGEVIFKIQKPLVDVIESENIISDSCCIMDIDLETVTKEELDFVSKYKIKINKQEVCHALVTWFDCYFTHGKSDILLSTSPFSQYTHWKQVIFYLDKDIQVNKGDELTGSIAVKKNLSNPRELDLKITIYREEKQIQNKYYKLS